MAWLLEGIGNSAADFIFVISPDPLVIYHTAYHVDPQRGGVPKGDGFSSFVHQREQLIEKFDQLDKPVLVFTGDVHASASRADHRQCVGDDVRPHGVDQPSPGHLWRWNDAAWVATGKARAGGVRIKWIGTFPDNVNYSRLRQPYYRGDSSEQCYAFATPERHRVSMGRVRCASGRRPLARRLHRPIGLRRRNLGEDPRALAGSGTMRYLGSRKERPSREE